MEVEGMEFRRLQGYLVNYKGGVSYDTANDGVLNTILCFDLVDRKFSMIVPPVDDEVCKKPVFDLCVFGGNLCMVYHDHNCHTDIWSWEGNNKGNWIKLMSIPCLMRIPYLTPVFLMNNGHELLLKTIMEEYMTPFAESYFKTKLFIYDQKQKTFRELDIGTRKVIAYTKSIVSPARDAGDDHESPIYRPDQSGVDIAEQVSEAILESQ
ncbi:hypothetical protein Q3G72_019859 [Acer saccharum]|nr:hypothetical protein Q3G72_019859 [Acer saccharum]